MDTGSYLTWPEVNIIAAVISLLNENGVCDIFAGELKFDVRPVDVNGEYVGEIKYVDGEYRWYPNGEGE